MNILFLSQIIPYPPHGGVLQRGYNIIRELSKHCRVHLLAYVHKDVLGTKELLDESRQELLKFCAGVEYFDLWPKRSALHKYGGFISSLLSPLPFSVLAHRSGAFRDRVNEVVRNEKISLVHFDTIALAQFSGPRITVPKVLTHHNIESGLMERRANVEANALKKLFLSNQARKLRDYELSESPKFDLNIFVSSVDEESFRQSVPGITSSVVPNGVDTSYFEPRYGREKPALIYTGGMNMFANKDAVLYFLNSIWPLIKSRVPGVKFYAVGQDPPPELVRMGKSDPYLEVTGYLQDIRQHVADASVYVVPLRVGGGTRLKVLDAMAMGKAIVSTSIGCEGIEAVNGRELVVADDPESFAQSTCELLASPERRVELGRAARRLVENRYSWEIIGRDLVNSYERTIRSAGRRLS